MNEFDKMVKSLRDGIEVPEKVMVDFQHTLAHLPKKHDKKTHWRKIAIVAMLMIGVFFLIPSSARIQAREYCKLMIYNIEDMLYGQHADVMQYTTKVNQIDKDGDLEIQLNDVLLDGNHMIFSYTVSSDNPKFYSMKEKNGGILEGYYDVGIEQITINGKSHNYEKMEFNGNTTTSDSEDHYTYPVMIEKCLYEFSDQFKELNDVLNIQLKVIAENGEKKDIRHFSYAFSIKNRELQEKTKKVPINKTLEKDYISIRFDQITLNDYSQKVYFYIDGMDDFEFRSDPSLKENPYSFYLEGQDESGNKVFSTGVEEIKDGYGYFELHPYDDKKRLKKDIQYYDFQLKYEWQDPKHLETTDEEEGIYYGKEGTVGETFRVFCNNEE